MREQSRMRGSTKQCSIPQPLMMVLVLALALSSVRCAAAAPTKWTILFYMLADNNLEPFANFDLEELMAAMADEPPGCTTTACDGSCSPDKVVTYSTASGCAGGSVKRRCCSPSNYPDVLVMVDKGAGQPLSYRVYANYPKMQYADYTLLESTWSNVKTVKALPGGQWQLITEEQELDLASTATIAGFLQEGFQRFPPTADIDRKYMVVYWDHGNGWLGYGADGTCTSTGTYADHYYCSVASLATLEAGIQQGLSGVVNPTTGQPLKLDIIGFDACLMSMYEIGSALAPYANYLLASELLEPGTGWDYSSLGYLVQGQLWSGAQVNSAVGFTEAQLADLLINSFMNSRSTGLTLALLDLRLMDTSAAGGLDATLNAVAADLKTQMSSAPALALQLLQQRTLLGTIEGAEDNVDLGALLTRLATITPAGALKDKINAALAAYRSSVVKFQHDQILADGTGMAIYFPSNRGSLDRKYTPFVGQDPLALNAWLDFLNGLYDAVVTVGTNQDLQALQFLETYAVPYWAVDSKTWITHGTLTNLAGLTADLMYGFISPTGTDFITAGTTVGRIAQYAAVGAWSGQLWGLVQDLTPDDGAVDGLALAYADEQKLTDADGNVQTLILQMQVYYAKSCYAPTTEMTPGMLKYTLTIATSDATLQLYTSAGSSKAWGEVSPTSDGVIIPYLQAIDLTGTRTGRAASFGYSDCLKWGYEDSIKVASFNATQAVGILGLDLTRDLATMLTVTGLNGRVKALYGAYEPAQKTQGGCQCAQLWSYKDANDQTMYVKGQCINPGGAHAHPWCQYEPESCTGTPTEVDGKPLTDFCAPVTTLSGCECHANWRLDGTSYYGSCANTGDPLGSWCVVNKTTCPSSYRSHGYGGKTVAATVGGVQTNLTGEDFDYCQVSTINKCQCSNTWEYGGETYSGTCRTGLLANTNAPGITADTNWCFVDKQCSKGKHIDGYVYDLCTPAGGRVTENGDACQFPATYHGVQLYDCISYNHSTPGVETAKPWCFTNAASGDWGYCAPWTCTAALKANCPTGNPDVNNDLTGWTTPDCLETLCNARKDLANVSLCTQDTDGDRTLLTTAYSTLAGSTQFGQLLTNARSADSLDAYCNKNFGVQCMDKILDPQCPGLFRQNNIWMASTNKAALCDSGCLKALCQLQEQAKTSVTGAPGISGQVKSITCADGELTTSIMWSLMRIIDTTCGLPGPVNLACNKLLAPTQLCAVDTQITAVSGNITDAAPLGSQYSASTECSWTINMPEQPYITMNFSRLATEKLYDLVTVEDFDGLIGRFSGNDVPSTLTTDTGLLRVKFSADGSLQDQGFAANYLASNTPQVYIPSCSGGSKLVQVVLRTRAYGSELSWIISKRSLLNVVFGPTPNEQNIVMTGGLLPPAVRTKVPQAIADLAQTDYKDYRSYYSYACLATGGYNLFSYDSYGDGWEGGRITLTQVVNATTGCVLLSGGSPTRFNLTTPFSVTADADVSSSACSSLTSPNGPYYYVEAGLVVLSEDTTTFTLAKQRKLKEGIASLLDVDAAQVTIQSLANATSTDITTGQSSMTSASRDVASRTAAAVAAAAAAAGTAGGTAAAGDADALAAAGFSQPATRKLQSPAAAAAAAAAGATGSAAAAGDADAMAAAGFSQPATRKLQSPAEDEATLAAMKVSANLDSIQAMLQQQQQLGRMAGRVRAQELSKIAVGVRELVASGALDATQRQLEQAEQWLRQQQQQPLGGRAEAHSPAEAEAAAAAAAAAAADETVAVNEEDTLTSGSAAEEAEAEAAAAADVAAAAAALAEGPSSHGANPTGAYASGLGADADTTADALAARDAAAEGVAELAALSRREGVEAGLIGEELVSGASESRKLQQLLTLTDEGAWQDVGQATASAAAGAGGSGEGVSPSPEVSPVLQTQPDVNSAIAVGGADSPASSDVGGSGSAAESSSDGAANAGAEGVGSSSSNSTSDVSEAVSSNGAGAGFDTGASTSSSSSSSSSSTSQPNGMGSSHASAAAANGTAANTNITDSTASGSSSSSNIQPVVPAVLAEKPLGPSAGTAPVSGPAHSSLMLQLQNYNPDHPVQPVTRGSSASKGVTGVVPVVEVKLSPTEAFGGVAARAAAVIGHAAAAAAKAAAGGGVVTGIAAVPKPSGGSGDSAESTVIAAAEREDGADPVAAAPAAAEPAAEGQSNITSASAAGAGSTSTANTGSSTDDELSFAPDSLPFRPGVLPEQSVGSDGTAYVLSEAIGPSRALLQAQGGGASAASTAVGSDGPVALPDTTISSSSSSGSARNSVRDESAELPYSPSQIDPKLLSEMIAAGRQRPKGNRRPRPPSGVFVATQPRLAANSSSSSSSSSTGGTFEGRTGMDGPQQQLQQQWERRPLEKGAAGVAEAAAGAVVLPLSWPEQLLAAEAASQQQQQQQNGRQLLQANPNKGVTLVVRVNGYPNASAASAAETDLRGVVTNGTLQTRLASQGWPGVCLGLLYTTTGSVGSFWSQNSMLALIIGVCAAGGVLAAGIVGVWYIRRRRQAGAAQVPGGPGGPFGPGSRPAVGVPAGGRASYMSQQLPYMSPQQAAAVVVPYPQSPYGRTASPSAPILLTPSQQAAFASGAAAVAQAPGPYGHAASSNPFSSGPSTRVNGRASMGPGYPGAGLVAPSGGYAAVPSGSVAGSGSSWSGPVRSSPQPPYQQQQQQQPQYPQQQQYHQQQQGQYNLMAVHPAPMTGQQGPGPANSSGRSSPYSFVAQPPAGYPVIAPGGAQQQWQQQ